MTAGALPPSVLRLHGPHTLNGSIRVPGDKSISHRALLLSAQAHGTSIITGLSQGDDVQRTRQCVTQLGAVAEEQPDGTLTVTSDGFREPDSPLDHGNSGTGIRLMSGAIASHDMFAVLTGDE